MTSQVDLTITELREILEAAEKYNADAVGIGQASTAGAHPYRVWRDHDPVHYARSGWTKAPA